MAATLSCSEWEDAPRAPSASLCGSGSALARFCRRFQEKRTEIFSWRADPLGLCQAESESQHVSSRSVWMQQEVPRGRPPLKALQRSARAGAPRPPSFHSSRCQFGVALTNTNDSRL